MSAHASTAEQASTRRSRKVRVGIVLSNRMMKTIVVRIDHRVRHPKYDRVIQQTSAFKVHDETNSAGVGDMVKIMETRPLSKEKRWRLVEVLKRASSAPPIPEETIEPQRGARAQSSASGQTTEGTSSEKT